MMRGLRRVWLATFLVACGNSNDIVDAGQDAGSDVTVASDATSNDASSKDVSTSDATADDASDASDDVAPVPCSVTLAGAATGTLDCVAHGAPYPTNMEQLSIHATPTTNVPYDVEILCNEYTPIQTTTYDKVWSPVNDDGCYATVIEQLPDGGKGQEWFVDKLGTDAGWVSMTLTYTHQTQTIYMTIDGHAEAFAPLLNDAGVSAVDIHASF